MTAYGGDVGTASQQCPTERGGQGTYYLRTVDTTGDEPSPHIALRCEGPPSIDSLSLIGSTDFSNSSTVDELLLKNCFLLTTPLVQLTSSLRVYSSILQPSEAAGGEQGSLTIECPSITTQSTSPRYSLIHARSLHVVASDLLLGPGDEIQYR